MDYVVMQAYDMKMPIEFLEPLVPMIIEVPSISKRLDIGVTSECNGIPLFHSFRGDTYPMLFMAGLGRGSTSHQGELPDGCRTVTYPTVLHHIKALLKAPTRRPKRNSTLYEKRKHIKKAIRDLEKIGHGLYGYRVEVQLRENFDFHYFFELGKKMTGDVPKEVHCTYVMDSETYIQNIRTFYDHCCRSGLFLGRISADISHKTLTLYYQLLNIIGYWSHILAYHINSMTLDKLPKFMSRLIKSCSGTTTFPPNAKKTKHQT